LLVEFSDHAAQTPAEDFDTLMYENQQGTVAHYYLQNSYGQLLISTTNLCSNIGWLTAPSEYSYYVNSSYGFGAYPQNTQKLVEDLVDLVDAEIDFSQYDNDGNGYVDMLLIVHAGTGAEFSGSPNDLWSTDWGITPRLLDGVYISSYAVLPEYWKMSSSPLDAGPPSP
jgi:immune inhibitor A